jgi:hypothetical protein
MKVYRGMEQAKPVILSIGFYMKLQVVPQP